MLESVIKKIAEQLNQNEFYINKFKLDEIVNNNPSFAGKFDYINLPIDYEVIYFNCRESLIQAMHLLISMIRYTLYIFMNVF